MGFKGPKLGVNYYKTISDQKNLNEKKERERQETEDQIVRTRSMQAIKRENMENEKRGRIKETLNDDVTKMGTRQQLRMNSKRSLKKRTSPTSRVELERSPSPVKYGMDLETQLRREKLSNYETEEELMNWIENITGEEMDHFYLHLKSGRTLCRMINVFKPGTIKKIHTMKIESLERENIFFFIQACKNYGIPEHTLFQVNDLYERKDMRSVVNTLLALARIVCNSPSYEGPVLQSVMGRVDKDKDITPPKPKPSTWLSSFFKTTKIISGIGIGLFLAWVGYKYYTKKQNIKIFDMLPNLKSFKWFK